MNLFFVFGWCHVTKNLAGPLPGANNLKLLNFILVQVLPPSDPRWCHDGNGDAMMMPWDKKYLMIDVANY